MNWGKSSTWNVEFDLDWKQEYPKDKPLVNPEIFGFPEESLPGYSNLQQKQNSDGSTQSILAA